MFQTENLEPWMVKHMNFNEMGVERADIGFVVIDHSIQTVIGGGDTSEECLNFIAAGRKGSVLIAKGVVRYGH